MQEMIMRYQRPGDCPYRQFRTCPVFLRGACKDPKVFPPECLGEVVEQNNSAEWDGTSPHAR